MYSCCLQDSSSTKFEVFVSDIVSCRLYHIVRMYPMPSRQLLSSVKLHRRRIADCCIDYTRYSSTRYCCTHFLLFTNTVCFFPFLAHNCCARTSIYTCPFCFLSPLWACLFQASLFKATSTRIGLMLGLIWLCCFLLFSNVFQFFRVCTIRVSTALPYIGDELLVTSSECENEHQQRLYL